MSFATLRRLRYVVLILTRADWQLHRGMSLEMELMLAELFLPIQDILATYCIKILSVRRTLTWSLQLKNSAIPDVAHEC